MPVPSAFDWPSVCHMSLYRAKNENGHARGNRERERAEALSLLLAVLMEKSTDPNLVEHRICLLLQEEKYFRWSLSGKW